jgi:hypothetical protein
MNAKHPTQRKEVTALDADVPLLRPSLIGFNSSGLRLLKRQADRPNARHVLVLHAG